MVLTSQQRSLCVLEFVFVFTLYIDCYRVTLWELDGWGFGQMRICIQHEIVVDVTEKDETTRVTKVQV
jgi:hypothetical protein